jgi:hypothetical protein
MIPIVVENHFDLFVEIVETFGADPPQVGEARALGVRLGLGLAPRTLPKWCDRDSCGRYPVLAVS